MSRRQFLQAGSLAGAVALAGCIEEMGTEFPENEEWPVSEYVPALPVEERRSILEERIPELAATDVTDPEGLASTLEEYEMAVESVERERDVLTLEYVNTDRHDEGNVHDVALIAGGYAALVDTGYDAVALGATILDDAPASYGSATVETPLATAYNDGDLTAAEYGELVVSTIESQRYEPAVDVSPDE
nr:twin-arginine translocation signal domain-containing protein [Natrinema longum]